MTQGGRPIDSVWKFYIKVEDGGKIRAKCLLEKSLAASYECCVHITKVWSGGQWVSSI